MSNVAEERPVIETDTAERSEDLLGRIDERFMKVAAGPKHRRKPTVADVHGAVVWLSAISTIYICGFITGMVLR